MAYTIDIIRTLRSIYEFEQRGDSGQVDNLNSILVAYLRSIMSNGRLEDVVNAEREGRWVVLPCKEGTPVWKIIGNPKWDQYTPYWQRGVPDEMKTPRYLLCKGEFSICDTPLFGKTVFPMEDKEKAEAICKAEVLESYV